MSLEIEGMGEYQVVTVNETGTTVPDQGFSERIGAAFEPLNHLEVKVGAVVLLIGATALGRKIKDSPKPWAESIRSFFTDKEQSAPGK